MRKFTIFCLYSDAKHNDFCMFCYSFCYLICWYFLQQVVFMAGSLILHIRKSTDVTYNTNYVLILCVHDSLEHCNHYCYWLHLCFSCCDNQSTNNISGHVITLGWTACWSFYIPPLISNSCLIKPRTLLHWVTIGLYLDLPLYK